MHIPYYGMAISFIRFIINREVSLFVTLEVDKADECVQFFIVSDPQPLCVSNFEVQCRRSSLPKSATSQTC